MDAATFLTVAEAAQELIDRDEVAARWLEPSTLEGYTVGGLAAHLARAVVTVERYLAAPAPDEPARLTDAAGYFLAVLADHDPVDSELHRQVRARGEEAGAGGPSAVSDQLDAARCALTRTLADTPADRRVAVLDGVVLTVEQYLVTRLVELVVHLDDLAVSVDLDGPPELPAEAVEQVIATLAVVAGRRAGPSAALRSLARRERHPDAVRAL